MVTFEPHVPLETGKGRRRRRRRRIKSFLLNNASSKKTKFTLSNICPPPRIPPPVSILLSQSLDRENQHVREVRKGKLRLGRHGPSTCPPMFRGTWRKRERERGIKWREAFRRRPDAEATMKAYRLPNTCHLSLVSRSFTTTKIGRAGNRAQHSLRSDCFRFGQKFFARRWKKKGKGENFSTRFKRVKLFLEIFSRTTRRSRRKNNTYEIIR